MALMRLRAGAAIEVLECEKDLPGAWYRAKLIQLSDTRIHCEVRYDDFVKDDNEEEKLVQTVEYCRVRPRPPPLALERPFAAGELVEVWDRDGWWMGRVARRIGNGKYEVEFELLPPSQRLEAHDAGNLRPLQRFMNGTWIRPDSNSTSIKDLVDAIIINDKGARGRKRGWHDALHQATKLRPRRRDTDTKKEGKKGNVSHKTRRTANF
ncbi:hypothetical protein KI387_009435 [Taxus chinensis]|uniref:Agenet domain-containing protein n=1 Tax=Taxus chinensis TaxID=29808 RepID=A0AA38CNG4_TAXCH|nr:hypothetical protein KI387_009435 [Taxus chinensis]